MYQPFQDLSYDWTLRQGAFGPETSRMAKDLGATENPPFDGFWHMKRGAPVEKGGTYEKWDVGEEVVKGKMTVSGDVIWLYVGDYVDDPGTNQVITYISFLSLYVEELVRFTAQYKLPRNISAHTSSTCSLQ